MLKKDTNSVGVFQPFVSKNDTLFSAWFADSDGNKATIATMKSDNGIDWYDKETLQLSYRNSVHDPFMLIDDNGYQLYFASSNFGNISLWTSVSQDGVNFQKGNEREILRSEYPWEGSNLSCPSVIEDNSLQYLFYAGSGNGWAIGMATSLDGTNWQKCGNNPFIPAGSGPQIVNYNNVFYLFYQSPTGLQVQQTDSLNGCATVWTNRHSISPPFGDPAPVVVGNDLWLYGTFGTLEGQAIGLAGNAQIEQPSYPVVLIPGMFASWNKEALLHNAVVPFDAWRLLPAVTEYAAIEKTLENIGYIKNTDYFLFMYDWRASLTATADNLNQFLENAIWNTHPYQPIQFIGHSLGGDIVQLYAQRNGKKPIKNVVTAGSPLLGTPQAYKPLAGGEIDKENNLMWVAEKLVLLLNKSKIENDRDTITRLMPILNDLLPLFPYLKNQDGDYVTSSLSNVTLSNAQINSAISRFYLGGSGYQTSSGYILESRTPIDTLLNIYPDGRPVSSWQENGDGVIPLKSTLNQISSAPVQNHGEIIYSKESIKTILSNLNMQVQDSDIPEGRATSIFPAILAFIQSPATIKISRNGITTEENEGMIWMQNAENGTYSLQVTGQSEGEYTVSIWLIGETDDKWIQFKKQTTEGKVDTFTISFDGTVGGTAEEYIAPTTTPTPSPTLTPSPTPTDIPQLSSSSNNSSQSINSEGKKENEDIPKTNTNFTQGISDTIKNVTRAFESKKPLLTKKGTIPQVLGVTSNKKIAYRSPPTILFFMKQVLWGASAMVMLLFDKVKEIKKWVEKK